MKRFLLLATLLTGCIEGNPSIVVDEPDATVPTLPDAAPPSPDAMPDASNTDAQHCGDIGEACCLTEHPCNNDAHMNFYCQADGDTYTCLPAVENCGSQGGACCRPYCDPVTGFCPTSPCDDGMECQTDICVIVDPVGCGHDGETCCVHDNGQHYCAFSLACDGEDASGNRICI